MAVTAVSAYSCWVNWSFAFLAVAVVIGLMVAPTPAPSLRSAAWTLFKVMGFLALGLVLMQLLHNQQAAGFAQVALILFTYFYLQAQGKVAALNGVTLLPAFGAGSIEGGVVFASGFVKCVLAAFPAVWLAFAVLPEGVFGRLPSATRVEGTAGDRGLFALRPVVVFMPLFVFMLSSENAIRYLIGYYQPAVIGSQPSLQHARALARNLMVATIAGCTAGVIVWYLARVWPSLLWFTLLVALTAFWFALRIFNGPGGVLSLNYYRWSYGLTTFVLVVFPDILSQGFSGDDASMKFYQRLLDYLFVTVYSVVGVLVYDAVIDRLRAWRGGTAGAPLEV